MNKLVNFIDGIEVQDIGLYDALDGDEARHELEELLDGAPVKLWIGNKAQRVMERRFIGGQKVGDHYMRRVPVVIVERISL